MPSVREVFIQLGIRSDPKGFARVNHGLANIVRSAKQAAAAFATIYAARAFTRLITDTASLGDSIDKVSSKLGLGAEALQELRFAAEQTGVAQNQLDMGLQRFIRRASEAARGTGESVKAFAEMGIALRDSSGQMRPAEDLLGDVAEALSRTKSDSDRVRLAFKLFDSEGVSLVNTLKGGRGALEALREKARQTGGIMSKELIEATVKYTDTIATLNLTMRGMRNILATGLLPIITDLAERFSGFIKENKGALNGLKEWLQLNRAIIGQGIADFFRRTARIIASLVSFIRRVNAVTNDWVNSLGPLGKRLWGIVKTIGLLAAILLLPGGSILLLIGLVALLIEDFETWRSGGESVIGDLVAKFRELIAPVEAYRDAAVGALEEVGAWADDNAMALTSLAGAVTALALAIGFNLVAANAAAIASFISLQGFALRYYAVLAAGAIKAAIIVRAQQLKIGAGWVLALGPIGAAIAIAAGVIAGIFVQLKEETGSWGKAWDLFWSTAWDFWKDQFSNFGNLLLTELMEAVEAVTGVFGKIGEWFSGLFGDEKPGREGPRTDAGFDADFARLLAGGPATVTAAAGAGGPISNNKEMTFNMEFNVPVGTNTEQLAEMIPPLLRREREREYRAGARDFAQGGAT